MEEIKMWRTKKDKDGRLIWEQFPPLKVNDIVKEFDPQTRARKFAAFGATVANEDQLTSDEQEMLNDVNDHIKQLEDWYQRGVGEIRKEINDKQHALEPAKYLHTLIYKFREKAEKLSLKFKEKQEQNYRRRQDAFRAKNAFIDQHNLDRKYAVYPESKILHFAWIFCAILVEAMANSYFFAQASPIGFLGGFVEALLISITNVAFAMLSGFLFLRQVNHYKVIRKMIGGYFFVLSLCLLFVLHLATAHYRELLTRNPDAEIISVLGPLREHPFALNDLESLLLIVIGIVISALGIWKGYTLDDPYPGFGKVYRNWKTLDDEMHKAKYEFKEELTKNFNETLEQLKNFLENAHHNKNYLNKLKEEVITFFNCINSYYAQAKNCANRLINLYRSKIHKVLEDETRFPLKDDLIDNNIASLNSREEKQNLLNEISAAVVKIEDYVQSFLKKEKTFIQELEKEYKKHCSEDAIEENLKEIAARKKKEDELMNSDDREKDR